MTQIICVNWQSEKVAIYIHTKHDMLMSQANMNIGPKGISKLFCLFSKDTYRTRNKPTLSELVIPQDSHGVIGTLY